MVGREQRRRTDVIGSGAADGRDAEGEEKLCE
jgi:hypothetical protein